MTSTDNSVVNARRKALFAAACSICIEAGFATAERAAVESLVEMLQSCLTEIARSSRAFCELTGRTEVLSGDVFMALVEMGINIESLGPFIKRSNRITLPTPAMAPRSTTPKILQAGEKKPLPPYIPDHFVAFPDPHAYIRTPTHKQPVTEYEAIREKVASQKRDVERALTRFIAKTGATQSLFADDTTLFPLIACKPMSQSYLCALLPKDQVFENDEEPFNPKEPHGNSPGGEKRPSANEVAEVDNPYLRSVKMPRKRKR
ncbi:transcription initiation factor TFIID subunit 8-like [Ornithodoros turicata]|uniref:transcription initiation factor TFIID subunit 8-like n=1 Tax=Ornithodoros turicata TaxID=34597 RepID=UPI0031393496